MSKPYRVRVEVEFPSVDDYLIIQRELNDGKVPLGKFAGVAVVTFFNQMVAEYREQLEFAKDTDTGPAPETEPSVSSDYYEEIAPEGVYYEGVPK